MSSFEKICDKGPCKQDMLQNNNNIQFLIIWCDYVVLYQMVWSVFSNDMEDDENDKWEKRGSRGLFHCIVPGL